jgi:hypothetical protein
MMDENDLYEILIQNLNTLLEKDLASGKIKIPAS